MSKINDKFKWQESNEIHYWNQEQNDKSKTWHKKFTWRRTVKSRDDLWTLFAFAQQLFVFFLFCSTMTMAANNCNDHLIDQININKLLQVKCTQTTIMIPEYCIQQQAHQLVGQAKRCTTKNRPKEVGGETFGCLLFCCRPEAASDVICSRFLGMIVPNKCVKFCDPCLNRSREILPKAAMGSISTVFPQ